MPVSESMPGVFRFHCLFRDKTSASDLLLSIREPDALLEARGFPNGKARHQFRIIRPTDFKIHIFLKFHFLLLKYSYFSNFKGGPLFPWCFWWFLECSLLKIRNPSYPPGSRTKADGNISEVGQLEPPSYYCSG